MFGGFAFGAGYFGDNPAMSSPVVTLPSHLAEFVSFAERGAVASFTDLRMFLSVDVDPAFDSFTDREFASFHVRPDFVSWSDLFNG